MIKPLRPKNNHLSGTDGRQYQDGYIVITPMKIGEDDTASLDNLQKHLNEVPSWRSEK